MAGGRTVVVAAAVSLLSGIADLHVVSRADGAAKPRKPAGKLKTMSAAVARDAAGNGMHLAVATMLFSYCFAMLHCHSEVVSFDMVEADVAPVKKPVPHKRRKHTVT
jgi:hypothetical protein